MSKILVKEQVAEMQATRWQMVGMLTEMEEKPIVDAAMARVREALKDVDDYDLHFIVLCILLAEVAEKAVAN